MKGWAQDIVRAAKSDGVVVLMPIELDGPKLLELAHGDHFAEHVETLDPDFFKALVAAATPPMTRAGVPDPDHAPGDGVRMGGTDEPALDP